MLKKLFLLLMVAVAMAYAAAPSQTFHNDHRASFVKLDIIPDAAQKTQADVDNETAATSYLEQNLATYGLANTGNLDLVDVKTSLVGTHFHFQQVLGNVKVHGAEIILSVSHDNGQVYMVYNNTFPTAAMKRLATANLDNDDAFDIAWTDLRVHGDLMAPPTAQMVYLPEGNTFRLVYLVETAFDAPFGYWEHTIDAVKGDVINVRSTTISRNIEEAVDFTDYKGVTYDRHQALARFEQKIKANRDPNTASKASTNGSGSVFDPDPVTALQNSSLSDTSPASSFSGAYVTRTLTGIDVTSGVYRLNGPWVNIADFDSPTSAPTTTSNGNWNFTRGNQGFNDAMTYFHIDQSQRYMQSLGFSGSTGIQYGSITADANGANGDDNSYFQPGNNRVSFGHGCVDDNEDAFVILHEYGHAIHHSINNNWSGGDTGGMGEGFGDYWGGSYRYRTGNGASFNSAWAFPWDGHNGCWGGRSMDKTTFQYDPTKSYPAHSTVGGVYSDELWSTPLFQSLLALRAQGVAHSEVDQIVLQAHFGLGSGLSMREMATAIVSTASTLYPSGPHSGVFQAKFEAQNILDGVITDPIGELENGQSVTNLSGASGSWQYFTVVIPAGATNFSVTMSGGTGDADLFTRSGAKPTSSLYNCRPYKSGNSETCTEASPAAGTWHIGLNAYSAYSGVTLTVNYTAPGGGGCTPGNSNQSSTSASSGTWKHYTINVPACATNLTVSMSGGSGDADLYTRFGAQPTSGTYDCRPYKTGNTESCNVTNPQTGTYYVSVYAYSTYSGANLTISYD